MNTITKPSFLIAVDCAIEHDDKFLMIQRPDGKHAGGLLSFAGGAFEIDDGELGNDVFINAAIREVQEELGLELSDKLQYVTSSYFIDTKANVPVVKVTFYCKIEHTKLDINVSKREVPDYFWLTYNEVVSHERCPEWIKQYMQKIKFLQEI